MEIERSVSLPDNVSPFQAGQEISTLGEGSFAVVKSYLINEQKYAVKVFIERPMITEDNTDSMGILRDMIIETATLIRLSHPNIVKIIAAGADLKSNRVFMTMPLAGQDLKRYLDFLDRKNEVVDPRLGKSFAYQLLCGLDYCHSRNVIHCDVKPNNILLMADGKILISDFGLAKTFSCIDDNREHEDVYTLWYRPIEILLGGKYDKKADVWAAGCTIYEIFTNRPLFIGDCVIQMLFTMFQEFGTPVGIFDDYPGWRDEFPQCIVSPDNMLRRGLETRDTQIREILLQMLKYDPKERTSLRPLIEMPYFDQYRNHPRLGNVEDYQSYSCLDNLLLRAYPIKVSEGLSANKVKMARINRSERMSDRAYFFYCYLIHEVSSHFENIDLNQSACYYLSNTINDNDYCLLETLLTDSGFTHNVLTTRVSEILDYLHYDLIVSVPSDFFSELGQFYSIQVAIQGLQFLYLLSVMSIYQEISTEQVALLALLLATRKLGVDFKHDKYLDELEGAYTQVRGELSHPLVKEMYSTFGLDIPYSEYVRF